MSFTVDRAFDLLLRAREEGRLAHAYLITGPEGSGKRDLAARLIRALNALPEEKATLDELASGNVTLVRPEMKSRRISVEAIREAERVVHLAVATGKTKFVVIDEADRLTEQAQNAFLKTLEEPPRGTVLLLLTANPQALLVTMLSRCIRLPLQGSGPRRLDEVSRAFLDSVGQHLAGSAGANGGLAGAFGLISRYGDLLKEAKEGIADRHAEQLKAEKNQYARTTEGDWLSRREEYFEALTVSEYLLFRQRLIDHLLAWLGDVLRLQQGVDRLELPECASSLRAVAAKLKPHEVLEKIDAIETLRSHYQTNVNEALAVEVAFMKVF